MARARVGGVQRTFNLNPETDTDLILKPCVGVICVMSSCERGRGTEAVGGMEGSAAGVPGTCASGQARWTHVCQRLERRGFARVVQAEH